MFDLSSPLCILCCVWLTFQIFCWWSPEHVRRSAVFWCLWPQRCSSVTSASPIWVTHDILWMQCVSALGNNISSSCVVEVCQLCFCPHTLRGTLAEFSPYYVCMSCVSPALSNNQVCGQRTLPQFVLIFGIHRVIQSDQGWNCSSHMFAQVFKQLQVKHSRPSAYHAQSQGALEHFHQMLKSLLPAFCTEMGKDWEEGLLWLMLAAREVTQESTGFSPNNLLFVHRWEQCNVTQKDTPPSRPVLGENKGIWTLAPDLKT